MKIFIQSEGLVCNRRQAYVIGLHSKRYVIKSQDLYVPFLRIDNIPSCDGLHTRLRFDLEAIFCYTVRKS